MREPPPHTRVFLPESWLRNPKKRGWVYVIQCGEFVKIGMAVDTSRRLTDLQRFCPYPLKLIVRKSVPYFMRLEFEAAVHHELAGYRHRGEWFQVDPETARVTVARVQIEMLRRQRAYERRWNGEIYEA